ncbi:MAG TPA: cell division protein FtsQ, partial [Pseudolysinimonas sp.]
MKRPEGVAAPVVASPKDVKPAKGAPPRAVRAEPVARKASTQTPRDPEKTRVRAAARTRKRYERLEVKRFTRRARRRRTAWFISLLLVAAVAALVAAAVFSPLL